MKTTDAFGDLLTTITASFLAGSEEDLNHPAIVAASDKFKTIFSGLPNQLAEARYEHHPLGTESTYHIEKRLVACVQQLAQDMGGLRSAAATQFSLLAESIERKCPVAQVTSCSPVPASSSTTTPLPAKDAAKPSVERRGSNDSSSSNEEGQSPVSYARSASNPGWKSGISRLLTGLSI